MKELTTIPRKSSAGQADTKDTTGKDLRTLPEGWETAYLFIKEKLNSVIYIPPLKNGVHLQRR